VVRGGFELRRFGAPDADIGDWTEDMSAAGDSVPAAAIRNASIARGNRAKQVYVIRSTAERPLEEIGRYVEEHLAYYDALSAAGKIFGAGPVWSEDGERWEGGGMIVVDVSSLDEAREIAEGDLLHQSGVRSWTITPWLINHGPPAP
jgi:uncharacterized protein YciI